MLLGGGVAMCCLYERGEPLDARGYWILAFMLTPYFVFVLLPLLWGKAEETDDDPDDDAPDDTA